MGNRLVRDRIERSGAVLDRAGLAGRRSGSPMRAGLVVNDGAIPTTVPNFFAVAPLKSIEGDECEACPGSTTEVVNAARDYVYIVGPKVPVVGDGLLYFGVGDRWAANWPAHQGPKPPCTACITATACGNPVSGVTVQVWNLSTVSIVASCTTDATGYCCVGAIPDGNYILAANKAGFTAFSRAISCPTGTTTTGSVAGYVSIGANDATSGAFIWNNPGNVTGAPDGTSATALSNNSQETDLIKGTAPAFPTPVPDNATITSIVLEIWASTTRATNDAHAYLVKAGVPQTAVDRATGVVAVSTSGITKITYTFPATGWTVADLNDPGFGGAWAAVNNSIISATVSADSMRLTANWSVTSPGSNSFSVDMTPKSKTVKFTATACAVGCGLAGTDCTVTGPGGTWTGTTAADGTVTVHCDGLTGGSYTITMVRAPFTTYTATMTISGPDCVVLSVNHLFLAVPNYFCCCDTKCYDPFPASVTLSWPADCFFAGDASATFTLMRSDPGTGVGATYGTGNPSVALPAPGCTTSQVVAHGFLLGLGSGTIGCPTALFFPVGPGCGVTVTG